MSKEIDELTKSEKYRLKGYVEYLKLALGELDAAPRAAEQKIRLVVHSLEQDIKICEEYLKG